MSSDRADNALEARDQLVEDGQGHSKETEMKLSIALPALLVAAFVTASTEPASAVVYCSYVGYPTGCVVRPGVVLRTRPVGRAVAREAVRPGTPMNRGGPVNRVGRR
jgi:hypothetical protein